MTTRPLTDEQLAELRHAIRKVDEHALMHSHGHLMTIVPRGDGEQLFLGADEPLVGVAPDPRIQSSMVTGHGLNIVHMTDAAYQWPDVRAFILLACNSAEQLLDMLVAARESAAHWKHMLKVTGVPVERAKVLIELFGDPEQLAKHGRALLTALEEYGNYKYLPNEHHKNCPYSPPEVDEETGEVFQNPCRCGHEAFHALKATIRNAVPPPPLPIVIRCPQCATQHIDEGEWIIRPHRTHLCASCKHEFRPMNIHTVGVAKLPPD